jgi:hypothetical protein
MREEYIKMRNSGKYNVNWFYRYYLESGGDDIDIQKFLFVFNSVPLNNILSHIDKKYELTTVHDGDKFICAVTD